MRSFRVVALATLIIIGSVGHAREEKQGYFSLNSSQTYVPGQKVSIDVWAQNLDTLEFRVYRVNDPFLGGQS
jgi:alpha-2-macroglobulin